MGLVGRGQLQQLDPARSPVAERADPGAGAALVKGGHLEGREIVDVLVTRGIQRAWRRPKLETTSTHGTGCTLSAAITAQLARGVALEDAVTSALDYVQRAIRFAPRVGGGHGPLNHSPPELRAN